MDHMKKLFYPFPRHELSRHVYEVSCIRCNSFRSFHSKSNIQSFREQSFSYEWFLYEFSILFHSQKLCCISCILSYHWNPHKSQLTGLSITNFKTFFGFRCFTVLTIWNHQKLHETNVAFAIENETYIHLYAVVCDVWVKHSCIWTVFHKIFRGTWRDANEYPIFRVALTPGNPILLVYFKLF